MIPSSEKPSVNDILCELQMKFKYNAACRIHSWDVFAMAAAMTNWAALTSTGFLCAYAQVFQEMCDVLILSPLNAFTSWHDSLHTCYPNASFFFHLPTEDGRLLVPEMTTEV